MNVGDAIRSSVIAMAAFALVACDSDPSAVDSVKGQAATSQAVVNEAAAAPADWSKRIEKTAEGGFRIGNPDAPVKLVEFASFTCSHCADFHKQAHAILKSQYVADGKMSYELRNFVMNPADYATSLIARCQTPAAYFALADNFFATQESWLKPFTEISKAQVDELNTMAPEKRMLRYVELGGLTNMLKARGFGQAKIEQCLTDKAAEKELEEIRKSAVEVYKLQGTPTFVINGETLANVHGWDALKPKLDAALN